MQLKVESETPSMARGHDRNGTSSIYISSPNVSDNGGVSDATERQKPVLTIQVNQNQSGGNENANNLVNIVSCFRASPQPTTITHRSGGIENSAATSNNSNNGAANLPFSVSVNKISSEAKNNQKNIVNIGENFRRSADDPNEISAAGPSVTSTVDYPNVTLDTGRVANQQASSELGGSAANESAIHQISIVSDSGGGGGVAESVQNQQLSKAVDDTSQAYREQRRRERRERRQARQRAAQHGHHRHHASVHGRASRTETQSSVAAARANGYEMLPDIINNHLPPPYSTLPLHQLHPSVNIAAPPPPPPPSHLPPPPPIIAAPLPLPVVVDDCRFSFPIPIIRRSPSEHSGRKGCCGQFLHSPKSLGLIAMIALGGVACALGGAAWGASGLAGQPSTHLTVSLLMIGIGVVLVTISGVAWRLTTADGSACFGMEGAEFDHCGRQQCLRNNSMSHGLLYPEFQHRQPPPTYQASMQEYRLRLLLLDRDRQSHGRRLANVTSAQASSSPPPTYRSNVGSQLRSHRVVVIPSSNGPNSIFHSNNDGDEAVTSVSASEETTSATSNHSSSVPSKEDATSDSAIKLTTSSQVTATHATNAALSAQINHKNGRQQVLINHSAASGVSKEINLQRSSQVKVNESCESNLTLSSVSLTQQPPNESVAASSLCVSAGASKNSFNSSSSSNESGMITIVTINNGDSNDTANSFTRDDKAINSIV